MIDTVLDVAPPAAALVAAVLAIVVRRSWSAGVGLMLVAIATAPAYYLIPPAVFEPSGNDLVSPPELIYVIAQQVALVGGWALVVAGLRTALLRHRTRARPTSG